MVFEDILDPDPDCNWTALLKEKAEAQNLSFDMNTRGNRAIYFHVASDEASLIGVTHNTREENRANHIQLDYSEEVGWVRGNGCPPSRFDIRSTREIVSIAIDHRVPGEYSEDDDNFIILTEEILRTLPDSGKKQFRVDPSGYPPPYNRHVNSWERLFETFDQPEASPEDL